MDIYIQRELRELSRPKRITIDYILKHGTRQIDVLAVMGGGEDYAEKVCSQLGGRGQLVKFRREHFHMDQTLVEKTLKDDPINLMFPLGIDPKRTIVICDDFIETGNILRKVVTYLIKRGYDFKNDNPLHFVAIEEFGIGYGNVMYDVAYDQELPPKIRLVRKFAPDVCYGISREK